MIRDHSGCEEDEAEACASMEILLNIGIAACINLWRHKLSFAAHRLLLWFIALETTAALQYATTPVVHLLWAREHR